MNIRLTAHEARIIGCLLEKQRTTPEQYPLSLNALVSACNQKSNRDPVMDLDTATVQETLDALVKKHFVSEKSGFGSRVTKYQQRFCNTEFGNLKLSEQELAIVCVLLLRGAQTPGELRTRTERLCRFEDVHEVEATLDQLMRREDGPLVAKLSREPGQREARFVELFSGESEPGGLAVSRATASPEREPDRLERLEMLVEQLRDEVALLKGRLDDVLPGAGSDTP